MIKLLLLGRSFKFSGGVTNYLQLMISNHNKDKITIKFFTQGRSPIKWKNIFYPLIMILQLIKLNNILKTYQPDIVHINPSLAWVAIIRDFFYLNIISAVRVFSWRRNLQLVTGRSKLRWHTLHHPTQPHGYQRVFAHQRVWRLSGRVCRRFLVLHVLNAATRSEFWSTGETGWDSSGEACIFPEYQISSIPLFQ